MRLLSLDYAPTYAVNDDVAIHTFGSDTSAFDFDVVLWDPARSFRRYWNRGRDATFDGLPTTDHDESAAMRADTARRKAEFVDFLKAGRTLVAIVGPPQIAYVHNGKFSTTGTGKNQSRIHEVVKLDLLSALPIELPDFVTASGQRVEPVGDDPIAQLLRKYSSNLRYTAVLGQPLNGRAVARVKDTDRVLGSIIRTPEGGHLVLMPRVEFAPLVDESTSPDDADVSSDWFDDEEDDPDADYELRFPPEAEQFQEDLLQALSSLSGHGELSRPAWASSYATLEQRKARERVADVAASVERARLRLAKLQARAEEVQQLDQLFLGTGRQLELRVRDVFKLLGCEVSEPAPGRADWHVDLGNASAVVEIKGLAKSAAEKNAAQLEKWVAAAFEATGTSPKGILVVNTWRHTPLAERSSPDFPEQMIPYSTARDHCLVTGLQLFVIAFDVMRDPSRKSYWRTMLLETSGLLQNVADWRTVLEQSETVAGEKDHLSDDAGTS